MIKTLRKKFILINMLLGTLVLLIVFLVLGVSNYQRLQNDSYNAMRRSLDRDQSQPPPKFEIGQDHPRKPYPSMPVFCVNVDNDANILSISKKNIEISEENMEQLVKAVLSSKKQSGVLSSYNLRFLLKTSETQPKIAFADLSNERNAMASFLLTSALVILGGLVAFFFISLYLSNWALRPIAKAWEQQRRFVADASHELKTPLTVILANTGILLSHRKDTVQQQIKWVENTKAEADRMKKLVDDLLYLAKSDAQKVPLVRCQFNISDAVWSCVLPFESVAFERGITLNSEISADPQMVGDEAKLKQLMVILLDNACKYAGAQGIVTVSLLPSQEKIKLIVNNTGMPIKKEELEHLFERFYRADKSRSQEQKGYGLGLPIAKSIVDSHRGKITVESNQSNGTSFIVTLPTQ